MKRRYWDGRTVHVTTLNNHSDHRSVEVALTPESAGHLANVLRILNRPEIAPLSPYLHELMVALDYVLVADPASVAAHRKMEASKGMNPVESNPPAVPRPLRFTDAVNHPFVEAARGRCAASGCSAPPEQHEGWNETTDPGLRALRRNPATEAGYPLGNRGVF
jgi:hypothetical protein